MEQKKKKHIQTTEISMVVFFQSVCVSRKTHIQQCMILMIFSNVFYCNQAKKKKKMFRWLYDISHFLHTHIQHISLWFWGLQLMSEWKWQKLSRCVPWVFWVRIQWLVMVGWVLRCGCGAAIGRCRPGRSGSSPAAHRRGKPPLPDELLPRGSPPPAAADWLPGKTSHIHSQWKLALFPLHQIVFFLLLHLNLWHKQAFKRKHCDFQPRHQYTQHPLFWSLISYALVTDIIPNYVKTSNGTEKWNWNCMVKRL